MQSLSRRLVAFLTGVSFAAIGLSNAQVLYYEDFEQPAISPGSFLEIPSGSQTFSNPGWQVTNVSDADAAVGVFIDNNFLFSSGSQVLAFGGGQSPLGNMIQTVISGFSGTFTPTISFDYFAAGALTQGIRVDVTDPNNAEALLFTASFNSTGQMATTPFFSNPTGNTVRVSVVQTGLTADSDSAIDNLRITAVAIPEPAAGALALAGAAAMCLRRRRFKA